MQMKLASALYEDLFSRRIRISTEDSDNHKCSIYYHALDENGNVSHTEFSKIANVTISRLKNKKRKSREAILKYEVFEPITFDKAIRYQTGQKINILFHEIYHLDIVDVSYEIANSVADIENLEHDLEHLMRNLFKILELGVPIEIVNELLDDTPISVIQPDISFEEFDAMSDEEKQQYVESQIVRFKGDEDDDE